MRLLLVQNFLLNEHGTVEDYVLYPHLGLLSLASVAENEGHQAALYDPMYELRQGALPFDRGLYRAMAEAIASRTPDVVGFTALGCNFVAVVRVADELRNAHPEIPILLGGPHATVLHEEIARRFPCFNVVVRNEAEHILPGLLRELRAGDLMKVPGITFRRNDELLSTPGQPLVEDLDTLPMPAYHKYPIRELGLTTMRVEAGRGCPFSCTFCSTASFFGRRYRLKSPERLLTELDLLAATYGIRDFSLQHDLFTVNRRKVLAFCEAVRGRGYAWSCSARIDCVDDPLLEAMRESGCRAIYYGVETGSPRMQKISQKRMDLALLSPRLGKTMALGMTPTVSFITGYPEELHEDQDQTLDVLGDCIDLGGDHLMAQLHMLTPEPGTKLLFDHKNALAYDGYITDFNFPTLDPRDELVIRENPSTFVNHFYFEAALPRRQHILVASAFRCLAALGNRVVSHLVYLRGGSLSALVRDLLTCRDTATPHASHVQGVTMANVTTYAVRRWGRGHYAVSLVRYLVEAQRLAQTLMNAVSKGGEQPSAASPGGCRFAESAAFLSDIHDAPRILNALKSCSNSELACREPALLRRRVAGLLVRCERANPSEARAWHVNRTSSRVLSRLRQVRPVSQIVAGLTRTQAAQARQLIGDLVDRGFVEVVPRMRAMRTDTRASSEVSGQAGRVSQAISQEGR